LMRRGALKILLLVNRLGRHVQTHALDIREGGSGRLLAKAGALALT
jgi:hypothetical protein